MQFKLSALTALALTTLAVATPARRNTPNEPASQCNTGDLQCCDTVTTANSAAASKIISLLGIVVQDVTAVVGLTCSPISVIGVSGNSWYAPLFFVTFNVLTDDGSTAQPVCCENNSFNGVIAIGCTPVNVNL
ncbi:hypothetical protein CVT25_011686 [Psilocybe cyanescens]|uniref:Hydrophobin n=1 Tax=Psilocybe cyanescens TaxID=93625 RepID=A0A409WIJ7_PSICY|nr:hypothetical protein CVT25_011686 [Psilocybe cyanescens]